MQWGGRDEPLGLKELERVWGRWKERGAPSP